MKVDVQYDVPVSAVVDTESGQVESVIVWDEAVEPRDGEYAVVDVESQIPVEASQAERAQVIAESATWPAWEIG